MPPLRSALLALALVATLSTAAFAQPVPGPDDRSEAASLERQIDRDLQALAVGDCSIACAALGSMRRSTARLCALEPGPRCTAARSKLDDAQSRVRTACPECAFETDADVKARPGAESPPQPDNRPEPAAAPPRESARGGCAGCEVGADSTSGEGHLAALALALLALSLLRRRR